MNSVSRGSVRRGGNICSPVRSPFGGRGTRGLRSSPDVPFRPQRGQPPDTSHLIPPDSSPPVSHGYASSCLCGTARRLLTTTTTSTTTTPPRRRRCHRRRCAVAVAPRDVLDKETLTRALGPCAPLPRAQECEAPADRCATHRTGRPREPSRNLGPLSLSYRRPAALLARE